MRMNLINFLQLNFFVAFKILGTAINVSELKDTEILEQTIKQRNRIFIGMEMIALLSDLLLKTHHDVINRFTRHLS